MTRVLILLLGLLCPALLAAQLPPPEQWVSYAEPGKPSFRLPTKATEGILSVHLPSGGGKGTGKEYRSVTNPTGAAVDLAYDAPVAGTHLFVAAIIDCPPMSKLGEAEGVEALRYIAQGLFADPNARVSNAGDGQSGSTLERTFMFWHEAPGPQQRKYTFVRMFWEMGTGTVYAFVVDGGTANQFADPVLAFFNQISLP